MSISNMHSIILMLCFVFVISLASAQQFELERTFNKHRAPISYVSFRAEDNLLVTGDEQGEVIFWNAENGKVLHRTKVHKNLITHIEFSPDALQMATASYDGTIKLWDLKTYKILRTFRNSKAEGFDEYTGAEPCFVLFTPNGKGLLYGGYNLEVLYAEIRTGKVRSIYWNELHTINCAQLSPDGKQLVLGVGNTIQFVKLKNFEWTPPIRLPDRFENYICELEFRPQSNILSAWLYDGRLESWNVKSRKKVQTLRASEKKGTSNIAFSGNGEFLVTGNQGKDTKLWNVKEQEVIQLLKAHKSEVVSFDYSGDGSYIVTGGKDNIIHLWKQKARAKPKAKHLPTTLKDREVEPQEVIEVKNSTIEIQLWDNQKIDGDIISVSLNGEWILEKHLLDGNKKILPVTFDSPKNYLVIHAENEGKVPPNTIAVMVRDGEIEKTITLKSNLKTSAALSLIYKPYKP